MTDGSKKAMSNRVNVPIMHQSIPSANIPSGNPRGFAKDPIPAGRDLYKPKFPRGRAFAQKILSTYMVKINSTYNKWLTRSVSPVPHQLIAATMSQSAFRYDIKYERNILSSQRSCLP